MPFLALQRVACPRWRKGCRYHPLTKYYAPIIDDDVPFVCRKEREPSAFRKLTFSSRGFPDASLPLLAASTLHAQSKHKSRHVLLALGEPRRHPGRGIRPRGIRKANARDSSALRSSGTQSRASNTDLDAGSIRSQPSRRP